MKLKAGIIGLICSILLAGAAWAAADRTSGFSDISGSWAEEVIYESQAAGFVSGYGDGKFKPSQNLSRAEALVMINHGLGWTEEAADLDTSAITYPSDLWSGYRGDIAVAAHKGLIDSSAISAMSFNSPAPRIEVAVWLAKALDLIADTDSIGFTDLTGISTENQKYLAGVVNAGYMSGYPDKTFKPNGSITRAEMCSIMSRMMHDDKMFPEDFKYVQGTIDKIDSNKFIITVNSVDYPLADSYVIFQNSKKSGFLGLTTGCAARILLDNTGRIIFIGATSGAASGNSAIIGTYKGYIVNKFTDFISVLLEDGSLFDLYSDE
ncbi:MAG: S-layer homology domain-containing protein, partial [Clostridia bacterium]|nr:S-layer homology domain-containing protein [Clostridia bacterium]